MTYKILLGNDAMTGVMRSVFVEEGFKAFFDINLYKDQESSIHYHCKRQTATKFFPGTICSACGDSVISAIDSEVCDDLNTINSDGCKSDCSGIEPGYICVDKPSPIGTECNGICGDGLLVGTEDCDDGGDNGVGCASGC